MAEYKTKLESVAAEQAFFGAFDILSTGYIAVSLFFVWRTYREGVQAGGGWDLPRIAGLLSGVAWPLVILVVCAAAFVAQRKSSKVRSSLGSAMAAFSRPGRRISVFGVAIVDQSFPDAVRRTLAMARGKAASTLFFVNAHTLNQATDSSSYRAVLNSADVVFGDGTGVRWAARLRGYRLAANLNGTDLVPALLSQEPGLRCFIVGSAPERTERIAADFRARFPGAVLVGCHHGYLNHAGSLKVIEEINGVKPDLLLVGMGNPIQERWIHSYRGRLNVPLTIAVGGLFEYWSGKLDRAPLWMRRAGIEWLHILRRQPWKARRYLIGNLQFMVRSVSWLSLDLRRKGAAT